MFGIDLKAKWWLPTNNDEVIPKMLYIFKRIKWISEDNKFLKLFI